LPACFQLYHHYGMARKMTYTTDQYG